MEERLSVLLKDIHSSYETLKHMDIPHPSLQKTLKQWLEQDFFKDLDLLKTKIHIEHFQVDVDMSAFAILESMIKTAYSDADVLQGQITQNEQQL